MEKMIEEHCQCLIDSLFSFTILDLSVFVINGTIVHFVLKTLKKRYLVFHGAFLLRMVLLPYLLEKLCTKYIYRILSYIYIFTCKHLLLKSIPKIFFSLVARIRQETIFGVSASVSVIPTCREKIVSVVSESASIVARTSRGKYSSVLFSSPLDNSISTIDEKTTLLPLIGVIISISNMSLNIFFLKWLLQVYYNVPINQARCNKTPVKEALSKSPFIQMTRHELTHVMERIFLPITKEGEHMKDGMGYDEFNALFEKSEPSLDEVKEAFNVFDQNKDGSVDARDLQRVLANLELREGKNLDTCEHMIAQHDRNGDGNVDLIDFSRLLEMSFLEKVD